MDFTKSLSVNTNEDLLDEQLKNTGFTERSINMSSLRCIIHNVQPEAEAVIDAIIANHDHTVMTDDQKIQSAANVAVTQAKSYLRNQLLAPDSIDTIYTALKVQVDSDSYLQTMVTSQIAITSNAFGWSLDLVTPSAIDKQRYIFIIQQVVALLT
jgi:hypothetical protein